MEYQCDTWAGPYEGCPDPPELLIIMRKNGLFFYRRVCQRHAEQLRAQAKAGKIIIVEEKYIYKV